MGGKNIEVLLITLIENVGFFGIKKKKRQTFIYDIYEISLQTESSSVL